MEVIEKLVFEVKIYKAFSQFFYQFTFSPQSVLSPSKSHSPTFLS